MRRCLSDLSKIEVTLYQSARYKCHCIIQQDRSDTVSFNKIEVTLYHSAR